jgi:hypothetical protein
MQNLVFPVLSQGEIRSKWYHMPVTRAGKGQTASGPQPRTCLWDPSRLGCWLAPIRVGPCHEPYSLNTNIDIVYLNCTAEKL